MEEEKPFVKRRFKSESPPPLRPQGKRPNKTVLLVLLLIYHPIELHIYISLIYILYNTQMKLNKMYVKCLNGINRRFFYSLQAYFLHTIQ